MINACRASPPLHHHLFSARQKASSKQNLTKARKCPRLFARPAPAVAQKQQAEASFAESAASSRGHML
eukprot:scaffold143853_cov42-Prasinocladus_malaysianus.AAC.1